MSRMFKNCEMKDLNSFKTSANAPTTFTGRAACRILFANQDLSLIFTDITENNNVLINVKDGERYDVPARKITTNEVVGAASTQFDITEPSTDTFRYTFDSTGTDPAITSATFPVGMEVYINADNFSAGNNGKFTVTASDTNYFEVTNSSGVVESNKTIGATGSINAYRTVSANYVTVMF